jgi:hypothetical protein
VKSRTVSIIASSCLLAGLWLGALLVMQSSWKGVGELAAHFEKLSDATRGLVSG